jgi:hypothetical protein
MDGCGEAVRLPSVWPYLALSALLALLVDFGAGYHAFHNSDSLVPVMVSLCRWTPFYWGGNRVGMLLPALALPFDHPLDNLLAQSGMTLFAAVAMMFLLARFALGRAGWPLAGCAGAALLLLVPTKLRFYLLTFQQMHYPVGLALGLGSLLLLERDAPRRPTRWHLAGALVLMALALWVNIGTAPLLGFLILARALFTAAAPEQPAPSWLAWLWGPARRAVSRETALALGVLVAAYVSADLNRRAHPMASDPVKAGLAGVETWPRAWRKMAAHLWRSELRPDAGRYAPPLLLAACSLWIPVASARARGALRAAAAVVAAAAGFALLSGATAWAQTSHDWRYWFPSYYLALGALAIASAGALAEVCPRRARAALTSLAGSTLVGVVLWQYGAPSRSGVRAELEQMAAGMVPQLADDVVAGNCTHLAGDYWTVLAAAYYCNLRLHEQGQGGVVWPVTFTSYETRKDWGRMPPDRVRVAVPLVGGRPDPEAETWLRNLSSWALPSMTVIDKRPTCWIFRPAGRL